MNLSFNFVDALVALTIVVSAGYAAWRGFLSETLSILAWVAAAFATLYFGPWAVPLAHRLLTTTWLAALVAYAGVFLVVFIPLSFMSYRFSQSVRNSPLGPLDRVLGVGFGVARGLVVIGLVYLAFTYFVPVRKQPDWLTEARFLPLMRSSGEVLLSLLPTRDQQVFASGAASPLEADDALARLIRRNEQPAPAKPVKKASKTYGAEDRRTLDSLFEAAGNGSGKP
jgi:membrane protein required for colicin V production